MKKLLLVAMIPFFIIPIFFAGCAKNTPPKEKDATLLCESNRKPAVQFCAGEKDCVFVCEGKVVIRDSIPKKISDEGETCMKIYAWIMTEIPEKTRKYIIISNRKDGLTCADAMMIQLEDQGKMKIVGISPNATPPTNERRTIPYVQ